MKGCPLGSVDAGRQVTVGWERVPGCETWRTVQLWDHVNVKRQWGLGEKGDSRASGIGVAGRNPPLPVISPSLEVKDVGRA